MGASRESEVLPTLYGDRLRLFGPSGIKRAHYYVVMRRDYRYMHINGARYTTSCPDGDWGRGWEPSLVPWVLFWMKLYPHTYLHTYIYMGVFVVSNSGTLFSVQINVCAP